jgi:arginase family protein
VSALRAKCPDCRTLTAVALDGDYQCHSCGREFAAGLLRVRSAWGVGGDGMKEGATLPLDWPDAGLVEAETLEQQVRAVAEQLPHRPLVLGGCCCSHVGAIRRLAERHGRLAVVWFDAHGDLNTPESSPSGNAWGMALRMAIDEGSVRPADVALVGARNLDPSEVDYTRSVGIDDDIARALADTDAVYVALDLDVLRPGEADVFFPEPGGPALAEVEALLRGLPRVDGLGLSGHLGSERNVGPLTRLARAAGL